jgi:hypothetical protein
MLHNYSTLQSPSINNIKKEVHYYIDNFCNKLSNYSKFITEKDCNNIIDTVLKKYIKDDNVIYTWTGWYAMGEEIVKHEIVKSICELIKIKQRRKIRGFLRSSYFLMKAYRASKEKLYAPDSDYVRDVLKRNFDEIKLKL